MTNPSFAPDQSTTEPEFGALDISPAVVAELLLKRRRIRRSLTDWLIDRLERVARGEIFYG